MQPDSDMDYRSSRYGVDEGDIQAQLDQEAKEQRWADFVAFLRMQFRRNVTTIGHMVAEAHMQSDLGCVTLSEKRQVIRAFGEAEGWPSVYAAIARAMREEHR